MLTVKPKAGCNTRVSMLTYWVMTFHGILAVIQIVLSVILVICILLQQTGASLGGAFGGDNFSAAYHTRRGTEKYLFYTTVIVGVLFALSAFVALIIQ